MKIIQVQNPDYKQLQIKIKMLKIKYSNNAKFNLNFDPLYFWEISFKNDNVYLNSSDRFSSGSINIRDIKNKGL